MVVILNGASSVILWVLVGLLTHDYMSPDNLWWVDVRWKHLTLYCLVFDILCALYTTLVFVIILFWPPPCRRRDGA